MALIYEFSDIRNKYDLRYYFNIFIGFIRRAKKIL